MVSLSNKDIGYITGDIKSKLDQYMQGQKIYSHITLQKGERSELAEPAGDLL